MFFRQPKQTTQPEFILPFNEIINDFLNVHEPDFKFLFEDFKKNPDPVKAVGMRVRMHLRESDRGHYVVWECTELKEEGNPVQREIQKILSNSPYAEEVLCQFFQGKSVRTKYTNAAALDIFCKQARIGNSLCLIELGNHYRHGLGVAQDLQKAYTCYRYGFAYSKWYTEYYKHEPKSFGYELTMHKLMRESPDDFAVQFHFLIFHGLQGGNFAETQKAINNRLGRYIPSKDHHEHVSPLFNAAAKSNPEKFVQLLLQESDLERVWPHVQIILDPDLHQDIKNRCDRVRLRQISEGLPQNITTGITGIIGHYANLFTHEQSIDLQVRALRSEIALQQITSRHPADLKEAREELTRIFAASVDTVSQINLVQHINQLGLWLHSAYWYLQHLEVSLQPWRGFSWMQSATNREQIAMMQPLKKQLDATLKKIVDLEFQNLLLQPQVEAWRELSGAFVGLAGACEKFPELGKPLQEISLCVMACNSGAKDFS